MKTPSVSLLLGVSVLLLSGLTVSAVSLNVSPNLQQFFRGDSVSLSCADDGQTAGGQTVKRTREGQTDQCERDFGTIDGSSCTVSPLSTSDSGVYWCETSSGRSLQVSITISVIDTTAGDAHLLEIPALPVMTGSDVTLRCRARSLGRVNASFFRDGGLLGSGPDGEFTLSNVQQSNAGLYWCVFEGVESPRSTLRVRDTSPPPSSSSSSPLVPVLAALGSLVLLLLVLGGLVLLWRKQRGTSTPPPPADVTYADVTITQTANRKEKRSADPETVYSGVKTRTAGPAEVTYGDIVIRSKRTAGTKTEQLSDPDVVYSSVRAGK